MIGRLLALVVVAALAAGCGVPTDGRAAEVDAEEVPFGLLDPNRQAATDPAPSGRVVVTVFLHSEEDEGLVPVSRRLSEPTLPAVLAELERSPSDREAARGLRSPLAEVDAVADASVEAGVATIDLSEPFTGISGSDQLIAIAQLVFTATAQPGVGQVGFTLDGEQVEIPRGDGSLTSDVVTRADYAALAPSA